MVSLSNHAPYEKLTFDMVKDNLLNEETKRKCSSKVISPTQNETLVMESRGKNMSKNS